MSEPQYQDLWMETQIARLKTLPELTEDQLAELQLLEETLRNRFANERNQNPIPPRQ